MGIPVRIRAIFFHVLSRIIYAISVANMRKPMRL